VQRVFVVTLLLPAWNADVQSLWMAEMRT